MTNSYTTTLSHGYSSHEYCLRTHVPSDPFYDDDGDGDGDYDYELIGDVEYYSDKEDNEAFYKSLEDYK